MFVTTTETIVTFLGDCGHSYPIVNYADDFEGGLEQAVSLTQEDGCYVCMGEFEDGYGFGDPSIGVVVSDKIHDVSLTVTDEKAAQSLASYLADGSVRPHKTFYGRPVVRWEVEGWTSQGSAFLAVVAHYSDHCMHIRTATRVEVSR